MKATAKLRLIGGAILLFNLWVIGQYRLEGIVALLLTFGFAAVFELLVVRPAGKAEVLPTATPASYDTPRPLVVPPPRTTARPSSTSSITPRTSEGKSEEELWAAALTEFEGSARRPGLWARAVAQANGDEGVAKAGYLRTRFSELQQEE